MMKQKVYTGPDGQRYVGVGRPPKIGEHYGVGGRYFAQRSADDGSYTSAIALAPVPCDPPEGWEYLIEGGEVAYRVPVQLKEAEWEPCIAFNDFSAPRVWRGRPSILDGGKRYILKRAGEGAKEPVAEPKRDEAVGLLREIVDAHAAVTGNDWTEAKYQRWIGAISAAKACFPPPTPPEREPSGRRRRDWREHTLSKVGNGLPDEHPCECPECRTTTYIGLEQRSGNDRRVDGRGREKFAAFHGSDTTPNSVAIPWRNGYRAARGAK